LPILTLILSLKEALESGAASNAGALEAAFGCAEGSQPGASIKTAGRSHLLCHLPLKQIEP
jgi:hypothetical protein